MSTNKLCLILKLLKLDDVYNYFLFKFLRRALFHDEYHLNTYFSSHIPSHNYHIRNTATLHFDLPVIRIEIECNSRIFNAIEINNSLLPFLSKPMSDIYLKKLYKL